MQSDFLAQTAEYLRVALRSDLHDPELSTRVQARRKVGTAAMTTLDGYSIQDLKDPIGMKGVLYDPTWTRLQAECQRLVGIAFEAWRNGSPTGHDFFWFAIHLRNRAYHERR